MNLQRLSDHLEIDNLLSRYCRAVDSSDWDMYRSMFTDDAHVDYSASGLVVGSRDEAVEYLRRHQASITTGMHYVTNVETTVDADTAAVVAMWFNAVSLPGATDIRFFSGRWHDELHRTPSGWRIRKLKLEVMS